MEDDDRPYVVESPTRIRLGPYARQLAQQYGLSLTEMARYLLDAHNADNAGADPAQRSMAAEDFLPNTTPSSENIEDRRGEQFVPDKTMQQIWGPVANVPLQAQTYYDAGLAHALGAGDIGRQPAPPQAQVFAPTAPRLPKAFRGYVPTVSPTPDVGY